MAGKSFVPIYRSLQDHWLWEDKPFSKGQAWVDLLMLANHKDKKRMLRGQMVTCKRGDVNTSMAELSKRWGWERGKVKRFLDLLQSDNMIVLNATTQRTTITIENYSIYNGQSTTDATTDTATVCTADAQQTPQRTHITNNDNNVKKGKKEKNIKSVLTLAPPEMVPALRDFVEMRQAIKSPLTARALELLIGKVNKLSDGDMQRAIDILNQSVANGWKSVYPLKDQNIEQKPRASTTAESLAESYDMLAEWAKGGT